MKNAFSVSKLQLVQYVHDSKDEIKWYETDMGYTARLGDATLFVVGSEYTVSMLTISADQEKYVVYEPLPLSEAPLGQWISGFRKHVLRQDPIPLSAEEQIAAQIKKMLGEVLSAATKQVIERHKDPQYERKLRRRIWNKLTGDQEL